MNYQKIRGKEIIVLVIHRVIKDKNSREKFLRCTLPYHTSPYKIMIELDGSTLEGGGQILRTACALSVVTQKPCHIFNIRKGRPKPGLMPQHLSGIQSLAQLCHGNLEGDILGSEEIKFSPGKTYRDRVSVNIPTAGSITLILQTLIPPALFGSKPVMISFEGGATDTFFSPTIDYFRHVFLKILEKMGARVEINILRRGYYPSGGAQVEVKIYPSKLKPLNLIEKAKFKKISIFSVASEFLKEKKVAERQARVAEETFKKLKLSIETEIEYAKTNCPGSSICIVSEYDNTIIGSDNLGRLGISSETVGQECTLQLLKEEKSGACVDKYLADQLLIYMALASGKSQIIVSEISSHCQTNIWTIEKFLEGKFDIRENLITWKAD